VFVVVFLFLTTTYGVYRKGILTSTYPSNQKVFQIRNYMITKSLYLLVSLGSSL